MASMAAEGQEPLRDWISLSVLFCFAFPDLALHGFLNSQMRNFDCAEIFTRFFSTNYLLAPEEGPQPPYEEGIRHQGAPGAWGTP